MRILILNQYFHPDMAATSQLLTELCEDLSRDHDVTVVCGRPSYDPLERSVSRGLVSEERHGGVRVLRTWSTSFGRGNMLGRLVNYATYLTSSLAGALRAPKPDVIMTMTDPPVVAAAAALVSWVRRVPFVYVVQDLFPQVGVALGRFRNPVLVRGLDALNRTLRRRAAAVVAIGRDMAARLEGLGVPPAKLSVIPNWSDGSLVHPLEGGSGLRTELGLADRFVVMHSGNVGFSQELETLIEAAAILRDRSDIHFLVAGNGAAKPGLVETVRHRGLENVTFLDYQPKDRLADSLGAADVHVVGLRRGLEGLIVPSKVYGVLAAGRPFVAAVDPASEVAMVAEEGRCGTRVDPGDAEALAAAIVRLREDPEEARAMGRRGRALLEERYDRPIAVAAYAGVLGNVCG